MKKLKLVLLIGLMALSMGLAGCAGDDGSAGTGGLSAFEIAVNNGFTGTEAEWLAMIDGSGIPATADLETCAVCHNNVEAIHQLTGLGEVSVVGSDFTADVVGDATLDVQVTIDIDVDGLPSADYTYSRGYVYYADPALAGSFAPQIELDTATHVRANTTSTLVPDSVTRGRYLLTIDGSTLPNGAIENNASYIWRLYGPGQTDAVFPVVDLGTTPARNLVTDAACAACHGQYPAWSEKFKHVKVGGSDCQICHARGNESQIIARDGTGALIPQFQIEADGDGLVDDESYVGSNFTEYIHGIHNSHNMPEQTYFRTTAADADATIEDRYSVGFPSNMRNCSVCHAGNTATVAATPPSIYLCFTCHNSWDNFTADLPAFHLGIEPFNSAGAPTNCATANCHDGSIPSAPTNAGEFHEVFEFSARSDSFFAGEDISFTNPDNVTFAIDSVTADGTNVSVNWSASKNGSAVDPCNTDLAVGPNYQGLGAYLAYAKGDDWVNEFVGDSPGQPAGAQNLFTSLTTVCAANVATTTGLVMDPEAVVYADKVLLALGGKPSDRFAGVAGQDYFVRETSPSYAFNAADGTAATPRRNAVDNAKCLGCHQGTLYQHGGDRVDSEQLCVICHNPSSSDKHNRKELYAITNADGSVNTDATYDGKDSETFDMRVMIHAIHGVNKRVPGSAAGDPKPWTLYRGRGIYQFVPQGLETILVPARGGGLEEALQAVDFPTPTGWPAAGGTDIFGSTNASTQTHNFITVHYPRPANECEACHNAEAYEAPNQALAVPLTVDAVGPDYADQSDDIVIGPAAAACTACHSEATTRIHATKNFGYKAKVTKEAMLEKAAQ